MPEHARVPHAPPVVSPAATTPILNHELLLPYAHYHPVHSSVRTSVVQPRRSSRILALCLPTKRSPPDQATHLRVACHQTRVARGQFDSGTSPLRQRRFAMPV